MESEIALLQSRMHLPMLPGESISKYSKKDVNHAAKRHTSILCSETTSTMWRNHYCELTIEQSDR